MANHGEGAPGRGVGGESIGARAGDSVCGAGWLARLSGPTLLTLSPHKGKTDPRRTAEADLGTAHAGHEVLAWSRAAWMR